MNGQIVLLVVGGQYYIGFHSGVNDPAQYELKFPVRVDVTHVPGMNPIKRGQMQIVTQFPFIVLPVASMMFHLQGVGYAVSELVEGTEWHTNYVKIMERALGDEPEKTLLSAATH